MNACSTFLYLDEATSTATGIATDSASTKPKTTAQLRQDTALVNLLRGAVDSAKGDDGWAHLSPVGQYIANRASFDPRNYGYPNLSSLVEASDLFEMRKVNQAVYVRARTANKTSNKATSAPASTPARKAGKKKPAVAVDPKPQ